MFLRILAVFWLLVLSACGGNGSLFDAPRTYTKPGATQQEFVTANYECQRDLRQAGYDSFFHATFGENQIYVQCMNAHGWYEVPK
jgi:hypothetical protein